MSAAKHTSGPWEIVAARTMLHIKGPKGELICSLSKGGFPFDTNPNAAVIATAPELLAELKQAVSTLKLVTGADFAAYCAEVDKLVAKAECRQ